MTDQQAQPQRGNAETPMTDEVAGLYAEVESLKRRVGIETRCKESSIRERDALRLTLERLQEPHIVVINRDNSTTWYISCSCSWARKLKDSPEAGQSNAMELATDHAEAIKAAAKAAADE